MAPLAPLGRGAGGEGIALLVLLRPVVVIVPLVVKITVRGKIRFVGEKFFMVNALKIFNHVQQYANQEKPTPESTSTLKANPFAIPLRAFVRRRVAP